MTLFAFLFSMGMLIFGGVIGFWLHWVVANPVVPKPPGQDDRHRYFVWESGYAASVLDRIHGRDGTEGNPHTANPYDVRTKG